MKAYSKVNLILKVCPKVKGDVKHKLHSVFCLYKPLYDEVTIVPSHQTSITCEFHHQECGIDKAATMRAIKFLSNKINKPIYLTIHIKKNIPIMSGLGGSSTDVATIMKWIIHKWNIALDKKDLKEIAVTIGSDIPFFLSGFNKAEVNGYGEVVNKFNRKLPRFRPIITNIPISTKDVYAAFDKLKKHPKRDFNNQYKQLVKGEVGQLNVLQDTAITLKPILKWWLKKDDKRFLSGTGGSIIEIIR